MSRYTQMLLKNEPTAGLDATTLTALAKKIVQPELSVESVEIPKDAGHNGVIALRGRLLIHNDDFFSRWIDEFRQVGYTPVLRKDDDDTDYVALHVMAGVPVVSTPNVWLNIALFIVTFISTLFVGSLYGDAAISKFSDLFSPQHLLSGMPFALTLLGILGAHEFGHYFAARYHRVAVSLPYFIPMPLGFGTLGAVIRMKEPVPDRRKLFDIGVAGPLAGLVLAIPLLLFGLASSPVAVPEPMAGAMLEGNSILYYFAKIAMLGKVLPNPITGEDVLMNQVTFAAWIGLLVTAINLLPVGQLDGGHAVYALFGKYARYVNIGTLATMFVLAVAGLEPLQRLVPGLVSVGYSGWFLWLALLIMLVGPFHPPALDDVSQLGPNRRLLGYFVIFIFIMIFVPVPMRPLAF
jgi:membrane-associated protease RseP (regulator of RpoE activity)